MMKSVSLWEMRQIETIEEFYKQKFEAVPDNLRSEIGHFNVFKLDPFVGSNVKPVPYSRRDYFKVMLVNGNYTMHYADGAFEIQKQALVFSNPQIPYSCEFNDRIDGGFFCVFTPAFFHHYGNLNQYSVFQPGGTHAFELTDEQVSKIAGIYKGMFDEINSEYQHKYDLLRNLVFELLHFAMKLPSVKFSKQPVNASQSITKLAHLQENMGSADFEFTPEELKNITDAISKIKIVGDRYPVRQTN